MFLGYENLAKGSLEATIIRIGRTPSLYKGQETNPEKNFDAFKHVISNAILLKKKSEDFLIRFRKNTKKSSEGDTR